MREAEDRALRAAGVRDAAAAMRAWQGGIRELVDAGIARGELRADAHGATVAALLTAALEGAIMITALLRDRTQMERVAGHLHAFIDGLRAHQPAPPPITPPPITPRPMRERNA